MPWPGVWHMSPICFHFCEHPFISLHTSEWPYDWRKCYFPKADFFLGHPVYILLINNFFIIILTYGAELLIWNQSYVMGICLKLFWPENIIIDHWIDLDHWPDLTKYWYCISQYPHLLRYVFQWLSQYPTFSSLHPTSSRIIRIKVWKFKAPYFNRIFLPIWP